MNGKPGPLRTPYAGCPHFFARPHGGASRLIGFALILAAVSLFQAHGAYGSQTLSCLSSITEVDAMLVADSKGRILYQKNESRKCIPASTLKVLTALAALEHFGPSYRFRTEFYLDPHQCLKVKGYGDPFLVSEVLEEVAGALSSKIRSFRSLIMDDGYFAPDIAIPGSDGTTNPYDAPVGAISANFNTVAFQRDKRGRMVSGERQTPLVPFAREQIDAMGLAPGRHAFFSDSRSAARYAGELLAYFLNKKGVACDGSIRSGTVGPADKLIYVHESSLPLNMLVRSMLNTSSNFMANQLFLALGASVYGPPGSLAKGANAVNHFVEKQLGLKAISIVEGSGLSRENRIAATDMLAVLKRFRPYEDLLRSKRGIYYKTGSLKGVRARVGYIQRDPSNIYYFVIFFNQPNYRMNEMLQCIIDAVGSRR